MGRDCKQENNMRSICKSITALYSKKKKATRWMSTKKFWNQYRLYLRSEQWFEKREKVLLRARYVCELCKEREASQVHHLTYERVFDERLEDLQALCVRCHKRAHKRGKTNEF